MCIFPALRSSCAFWCLLLFQEKAITPGESCLFPGTDWLIGNHSDELTPWIPVIAARRVISRHNLTQQLKCQLISPIGNIIMDVWLWVCEYVCVFVGSLVCVCDHLMAMLSLSPRTVSVLNLGESNTNSNILSLQTCNDLLVWLWVITCLLLSLQVLSLLPLLRPALLLLWLLWKIPEAPV